MNVKIRSVLMVVLLMAVTAGGYALGRMSVGAEAVDERETPAVRKTIAKAGDEVTLAALRRRVKELEAKLASVPAPTENVSGPKKTGEEEPRGVADDRGDRGRFDPRERMEELKKSDPVKYAQITNRMARMHQNRKEREQAKAGYLASIDTSHMSASAKKTHNELQELMEKKAELEAKMDENRENGLTPDDESVRETFEEMREIDQQMRKLNGEERDNLLAETAAAVGLEGEDAQEMVDTIKDIYESTEGNRGGHHEPPMEGSPEMMNAK